MNQKDIKYTRKVKVKNALGLHARPATVIARLLQKSKSKVFFTYRKETINARSIMSLLMLAATKNALITMVAVGEDAQQTLELLAEAFKNQFGESSV